MKTICEILKYRDGKIWYRYSCSETACYYVTIKNFINLIVTEQVNVKLE